MAILVIEDDSEVVGCVSYLLREEGYTVDSAGDGQKALEYLDTHSAPSLILLDLSMPNMDGLEFRKRQLADARLAAIETVVMSGRADGRAGARALGVDQFLSKPVNLDELLHIVQNRAKTVPRAEHFLRGALRRSPRR